MHDDKIDVQKGLSYLAGKKEFYIKIVDKFIKQKDAKISELNQFLEEDNFDRLTIEFHGLKSTSATLGSSLMPPFASELEAAGKDNNTQLIKEKYKAFIAQYEDTCVALQVVIDEMG